MVDAAKAAGAEVVKHQTHIVEGKYYCCIIFLAA